MVSDKKVKRENPIPEGKQKVVKEIKKLIDSHTTILVASSAKLPASQFQKIKKKMRGIAIVAVAKKSLVLRAIDESKDSSLKELKPHVGANVALFFSNRDAFELSGMLIENQSPTKAKTGDIAPEDIVVEPGPTDLPPGPAISELSGVGLKVAVEGGKLAIKNQFTIVKAGGVISDKVSGVMAKLNITPMKVGFLPVAAYDANAKQVYANIKIDKKAALEELRIAIGKGLGFAVGVKYPSKETITFFIRKAGIEAIAFEKLASSKTDVQSGKEDTQ